jgi:hypothetical protein
MEMRGWSFAPKLVLLVVVTGALFLAPTAAAKRKPPPPPPPPPSTTTTYAKNYADVLDGAQDGLTPEVVRATSDGGSISLALTDTRGVSWLVKLDRYGAPQWQEEVGCFNLPPGSFAYGVSLEQTADGGYVVGGGTIGCGSSTICPQLSGIQCALVERLDPTGGLVWARVYSTGASWTAVNAIRQTTDGGFVAAGSAQDDRIGALILRLDSSGNVVWQRQLGPAGTTSAYLNDVRQTADGGFVATGEFETPSGDRPRTSVLLVKVDPNGNVLWQRGFNTLDGNGAPNAAEHALSVINTSDGGYLVAGNWDDTTSPGTCCRGALLLKLDANGTPQWQKAYSGGVYCFFNGYSQTCSALGSVAYSVHQTSDGGYVLAGDGDLKLNDSAPLVPWLARVDASGNLVWQYFYYQSHPTTGRPLSEYFASSTLTDAGVLALGFTENPTNLKGELFAVQTDAAGLVAGCSQVHPAEALDTIDPGLASIAPALPVQTGTTAQDLSPSATRPTSITYTSGQC